MSAKSAITPVSDRNVEGSGQPLCNCVVSSVLLGLSITFPNEQPCSQTIGFLLIRGFHANICAQLL